VRFSAGARALASGRLPGGYPTGITRFVLDHTITRRLSDATVCVANRGDKVLNAYGDYSAGLKLSAPAYADGVPVSIRLDWYGARPRTWWSMVGTIADRFGLVKAGIVGAWAFWAALAALLVLSVLAVGRALREAPR
jgi:hypothetical protein